MHHLRAFMMRVTYERIMAGDVLVQTRVSPTVARWLRRRAEAEGLTVAALARKLLMTEMNMMRVDAWSLRDEDASREPAAAPTWTLERSRDRPSGGVEYALLHGPGAHHAGAPVSDSYVSDMGWFLRPHEHRFRLRGSSQPRVIIETLFDSASGGMVVVLGT